MDTQFIRPRAAELVRRLKEPRRFIQSISGARQVGKTTLAVQVAERSKLPCCFASADEPTLRAGEGWIESQWEEARRKAGGRNRNALLILDEVQKIPRWSATVKGLWDEDTRARRKVKVVLRKGKKLVAIEVKSGKAPGVFPGLDEFAKAFKPTRSLLVGKGGVSIETFLSAPVARWLK